MGQWIKLKRKALAGEKVDSAKLAKIQDELVKSAEEKVTACRGSTEKIIQSITEEAFTSGKVTGVLEDIKKTVTDDNSVKEL